MAIKQEFKGGDGKFIKKPGEYVVEVDTYSIEKDKKQRRMLRVEFKTFHGEKISGWYIQELPFAMKKLTALKVACGLAGNAPAEAMLGKTCGIAVGEGSPREDGTPFMQIIGYGKASDVENQPVPDDYVAPEGEAHTPHPGSAGTTGQPPSGF